MKLDKRVIDRAMENKDLRAQVECMLVDIVVDAEALQRNIDWRREVNESFELMNKKEMRRVYYAAKRIVAMFEEAAR